MLEAIFGQSSKTHMKKKIIGHIDKIDLPDLGIEDVECKIDTGADTSSIHCTRVRVVEKDGTEVLTFKVLDKHHPLFKDQVFTVSDFKERNIKSSNGISESRFVIRTKIVAFGKKFNAQFTLRDREKMKFPVLLGKRFLKQRFLVDVTEENLSFKQKTHHK